jgi:polar amino acid transport system substrate-binding protein
MSLPQQVPMANLWRLTAGIVAGGLVAPGLCPSSAKATPLDKIQKRGTLIVAVKDNWFPLGFRDRTGQLQGFEITIARQLATDLLGSDQKVIFKPVQNTERLTAITTGIVDIAIANLTITENRQRLVMFSDAYYRSGTGILTSDARLNRLSTLSRKAIAVLQPSVTLPYLRSFLPAAQLQGVPSYQSALERLNTHQVEAVVGDQIVLSAQAKQAGYYFYPTRLTVQPLGMAFPKGVQHESLRAAINDRLAHWQQSGWLQNQQKIWGLP